jgi:hypothetical protein
MLLLLQVPACALVLAFAVAAVAHTWQASRLLLLQQQEQHSSAVLCAVLLVQFGVVCAGQSAGICQ